MIKPHVEYETLESGGQLSVIWQRCEDGVSEPALFVRTYDNGDNKLLIGIRQADQEVLINGESMPALFKLIKEML